MTVNSILQSLPSNYLKDLSKNQKVRIDSCLSFHSPLPVFPELFPVYPQGFELYSNLFLALPNLSKFAVQIAVHTNCITLHSTQKRSAGPVLDCLVQQQHKDANCLKSQFSQRDRTRRLILSFISGGGREPAGHGYIIYECMGLWVYGIYKQKRMFCNHKKVFCHQVIKKIKTVIWKAA